MVKYLSRMFKGLSSILRRRRRKKKSKRKRERGRKGRGPTIMKASGSDEKGDKQQDQVRTRD